MDDHISTAPWPTGSQQSPLHSHCILPSPRRWGPLKKPPGRLTIHMAHIWCLLEMDPLFQLAQKCSSQSPWSVAISLPSQDYLFPYIFTLLLLWRLSRTTLKPLPTLPLHCRQMLHCLSHQGCPLKWQGSPYFSPRWWEWAQHSNSCPWEEPSIQALHLRSFKGCQWVTINAVRSGFTPFLSMSWIVIQLHILL